MSGHPGIPRLQAREEVNKEVMWNRTQIMCSTTGELAEAMAAFVEKRPARFHT
ncbi:MAG TPA: hypothetical protein VMU63_06755 [Acidimicrobiales bacterium]|nr:hypothetical protein [Acidimicrobiales bacterium]